jgi:hypothetical protein
MLQAQLEEVKSIVDSMTPDAVSITSGLESLKTGCELASTHFIQFLDEINANGDLNGIPGLQAFKESLQEKANMMKAWSGALGTIVSTVNTLDTNITTADAALTPPAEPVVVTTPEPETNPLPDPTPVTVADPVDLTDQEPVTSDPAEPVVTEPVVEPTSQTDADGNPPG